MDIKTEALQPQVLLVSLNGRFDLHSAGQVKALWADDETVRSLVFDLTDVSFMDSTALATLVSALKLARARGGSVFIVNPSPAVRTVFDLTRMDRVFQIEASLDAVRNALG